MDKKPHEHEHDMHHLYDADRRGEHKHPERDDQDRPSQRERDALKTRLDRESTKPDEPHNP